MAEVRAASQAPGLARKWVSYGLAVGAAACERHTGPVASTETDTWRRTTRMAGSSRGCQAAFPRGPPSPCWAGLPLTEFLIPHQVSGWWGSGSGYPPCFCPNLLLFLQVLTVKRILRRPVVKSHIEEGRGSPSLTRFNVLDVVFKFLGSCPMHLPENVRAQWVSDKAAHTWGASGARLLLGAN